MTYRGAVFFDYDGTITDEKAGVHLPTEKTLAAFEALRKNGYLVVLATGRAIPYARHVLGYFDGVVTSNGTFSMVRQEVVADHPIEAPLLRELVPELQRLLKQRLVKPKTSAPQATHLRVLLKKQKTQQRQLSQQVLLPKRPQLKQVKLLQRKKPNP